MFQEWVGGVSVGPRQTLDQGCLAPHHIPSHIPQLYIYRSISETLLKPTLMVCKQEMKLSTYDIETKNGQRARFG